MADQKGSAVARSQWMKRWTCPDPDRAGGAFGDWADARRVVPLRQNRNRHDWLRIRALRRSTIIETGAGIEVLVGQRVQSVEAHRPPRYLNRSPGLWNDALRIFTEARVPGSGPFSPVRSPATPMCTGRCPFPYSSPNRTRLLH